MYNVTSTTARRSLFAYSQRRNQKLFRGEGGGREERGVFLPYLPSLSSFPPLSSPSAAK